MLSENEKENTLGFVAFIEKKDFNTDQFDFGDQEENGINIFYEIPEEEVGNDFNAEKTILGEILLPDSNKKLNIQELTRRINKG